MSMRPLFTPTNLDRPLVAVAFHPTCSLLCNNNCRSTAGIVDVAQARSENLSKPLGAREQARAAADPALDSPYQAHYTARGRVGPPC